MFPSEHLIESEKSYSFNTSYRAFVKAQCVRNPSLLNLDNFLSNPRGRRHGCTVAALDFEKGNNHPTVRTDLAVDGLSLELRGKSFRENEYLRDARPQGRVLIIQDLTKEVVELLGSELDVDPLFFALHLHTAGKTGMCRQTPEDATLPSRLLSKGYISISYHRVITCDPGILPRRKLLRDTVIDRKLVFLPSTNIGLAQHCASVIRTKQTNGFWIALILVDPPIGDTYFLDGRKDEESSKIRLRSEPYLAAYEDFLDPPSFSRHLSHSEVPLGAGMLKDLTQYWACGIPDGFDTINPTIQSLAYYPLRIVAAEWVKYVAVMQYCLKHYEYQNDGTPELEKFNTSLRELQSWRRRSMLSQQKIQSVIRFLNGRIASKSEDSDPNDMHYMQPLISDLEFISTKIDDYGRRLENMILVLTSLVQIVDARRSFAETANISRLTVLALIFVPLSYVCSLFSMNPTNAPGSQYFWVYFVVAIPVTLLVIVIARPPSTLFRKIIAWAQALEKRRRATSGTAGSKDMQA